jgi:two-component system response regulator YesN
VNDYITEYRIEKAKVLLGTNRYKIYEVCSRVGMNDPRHFSQMFKRYTNVTPKEYMKSCMYD